MVDAELHVSAQPPRPSVQEQLGAPRGLDSPAQDGPAEAAGVYDARLVMHLGPAYILVLFAAEVLTAVTAGAASFVGPVLDGVLLLVLVLHSAVSWKRPFRYLPAALASSPAAHLLLAVLLPGSEHGPYAYISSAVALIGAVVAAVVVLRVRPDFVNLNPLFLGRACLDNYSPLRSKRMRGRGRRGNLLAQDRALANWRGVEKLPGLVGSLWLLAVRLVLRQVQKLSLLLRAGLAFWWRAASSLRVLAGSWGARGIAWVHRACAPARAGRWPSWAAGRRTWATLRTLKVPLWSLGIVLLANVLLLVVIAGVLAARSGDAPMGLLAIGQAVTSLPGEDLSKGVALAGSQPAQGKLLTGQGLRLVRAGRSAGAASLRSMPAMYAPPTAPAALSDRLRVEYETEVLALPSNLAETPLADPLVDGQIRGSEGAWHRFEPDERFEVTPLALVIPTLVPTPLPTLIPLPTAAPQQSPQCPGGGYENLYPRGVCTWYAKEMRPDLPWFYGDNGLAMYWAQSARACGFIVSDWPAAGAVIVFPPGANGASPGGHVGYVEAVGDDYVLISECNVGHDSVFVESPLWWEAGYSCAYRRIPHDRVGYGVQYIHGRAE